MDSPLPHIYSDIQLCTAGLINGSKIRLDINAGAETRVQPPKPTPTPTPTPSLKRGRHSSAAGTSNAKKLFPLRSIPRREIEILPPLPPDDKIIVRVQFGEFYLKEGVRVKASKKARKLRAAILKELKIKLPDSYIFFHDGKPVKERKSFTQQKICHGSFIQIYAPLNNPEVLQQFCVDPISPNEDDQEEEQKNPNEESDDDIHNMDYSVYCEDDYIFVMTVKVLRGNESTEVEVMKTQAVYQLRVNLEKMRGIQLPARYSFFHKGNPLDEDLTFEAQNVVDGDEVIICDESDNDTKITVKVMHGSNEMTEVNALKSDFAYQLRVNMMKMPGIELPAHYAFFHKGNQLNEARSLAAQNVVGGDEVQLANAWKLQYDLMKDAYGAEGLYSF